MLHVKHLLIASAILGLLALPAHATECRGKDEAACTNTAGCRWMPARKAGDISPRTKQPYLTSAKAHCRAGRQPVAAKPTGDA